MNIFEDIIPLLILVVVDYLLSVICEKLPRVRFLNWQGIFKSSIPTPQCDIPPPRNTRLARRKQRGPRRGRRSQVNVARSDPGQTVSLQEDTPQEDGAVHITGRSTDSSKQPLTDVNKDFSSSENGLSNIEGSQLLVQEKHQSEAETHSQSKLTAAKSAAGQDGKAGKEKVAQGGKTQMSLPKAEKRMAQDNQKANGSKKKGWMNKKKDLKSPWAEWKKATECKRVVQKAKRKTFQYPYQVDTSITGGKSADDNNVNTEPAAPTLDKDETLNKLTEEQSDKNRSTSEQSPEVSSNDIKTPEESDGDKTTSESTDETTKSEEEIPSDVLRISMVETIYESKAVIIGKPTKTGRKVTSTKSFERRRPFRTRASTRTPTASSFGQKRSPSEWQVTVAHKKTLGHKKKNCQCSGPPSIDQSSSEAAQVPNKNVLSSRLDTTTVGGGLLREQNTKEHSPSPDTTINKTAVKEVSGTDSMVVCKSPQTDPANSTNAINGTLQPSDQTTLNNTMTAYSSPTSDVPDSSESNSDLIENRQLAKIGRRKRARLRKRIALAAAEAALKFRERIRTTSDGEIIINRDEEDIKSHIDCEEEMDTPFPLKDQGLSPDTTTNKIEMKEVSVKDSTVVCKSPQTDPANNTNASDINGAFQPSDQTTSHNTVTAYSSPSSDVHDSSDQGLAPDTTTNKTEMKEVSGTDSTVVCKSPQTDPVHNINASNGALQQDDQTTSNTTLTAHSSPTSDVPDSSESNSDLIENRRLAKIGRRKRARLRKRIALAAAEAALKFRERIRTTSDGEIIINRDEDDTKSHIDCEEEMDTPFPLKDQGLSPDTTTNKTEMKEVSVKDSTVVCKSPQTDPANNTNASDINGALQPSDQTTSHNTVTAYSSPSSDVHDSSDQGLAPDTTTNKTEMKEVSGTDSTVVCKSPQTDPVHNINASNGALQQGDQTTSNTTLTDYSSPTSDVPDSSESNSDLIESRRLAKIGRRKRARLRKQIAHAAAEAALKFRERILTSSDGEIIINRDEEDLKFHIDCEEDMDTPFSIKNQEKSDWFNDEAETHSQSKLTAEESSAGQDGEAGKEIVAQDGETHKSLPKAENHMAQDKKEAKGSKKNGWMNKRKDLKSPWAEWKKATECKRVVQKAKRKTFQYPYQVDTSITGGKSADDNNVNREPAAPTLQDNKDETLNKLPEEQSDKNRSTSEQSPEVSSNDIKTPEESDGDKTTSESTDETTKSEEEIPSDVLRISMVETIYESKAVITGKPTKTGRKVTSTKSFERRRPFRTRASTRTPTASSFRKKRSPSEWQVTVTHKKTLGHKKKMYQSSEPPSIDTLSSEAALPNKNVLSSRLDTTTVGGGLLREQNTKDQGPSPDTSINKTGVKEVSGKGSMVVCKSPQTDPANITNASNINGALQPSDQTTSNNTVSAYSSTTSDVPDLSESNPDLIENRRLAKIGRRKRARARKRIAQAAAEAALKFRERILTTSDGEIIINRDEEDFEFHRDCEEEMDTPFSIKMEICPPRVCVPEWVKRHLPQNSYLQLKTSKTTNT